MPWICFQNSLASQKWKESQEFLNSALRISRMCEPCSAIAMAICRTLCILFFPPQKFSFLEMIILYMSWRTWANFEYHSEDQIRLLSPHSPQKCFLLQMLIAVSNEHCPHHPHQYCQCEYHDRDVKEHLSVVNANITRNTSPEGRTGSPAPSQDVSFSIKRTLGARLSLSPSPLPRSSPKSSPSFSVFEIEQMSQLRVQIIKMLVPWRLSTFFKSWPLDICSLFKKLVPWQLFTF